MAAVIVQAKSFLVNAASATISLDAAVTAGNGLIIQTLGASTRTYSYSTSDGAFTENVDETSVQYRSIIHSRFNLTGGSADITATANSSGDRWITVVEVSGLGASPTVDAGSSETDTTDQNVTTHNCAVPGLDGHVDDFVIAGGRLNASPGTLTRHPGLSADYQIPGGALFGITQWGVLSTEYLANAWAYTSTSTRQNVNTAAVFSPTSADIVAPTLSTATIDDTGEELTLVFSENVAGNTGITLTGEEGAITATYSSGSGTNTLVYSLSRPAHLGETLTLDYTPGNIEDTASNALEAIADRAVTNNSSYEPPPAIFTAVVKRNGVTEATIESATSTLTYTPQSTGNYTMEVTRVSSSRAGTTPPVTVS